MTLIDLRGIKATWSVYVSPEKYAFHLHKGRLCQHSSFFRGAFHGSFEEATTESVYLEEYGVDEFKLFKEWLFSEKFSFPKDSDNPSLLLVKVFCFAERVRTPAFRMLRLTLSVIEPQSNMSLCQLQIQITKHTQNRKPLEEHIKKGRHDHGKSTLHSSALTSRPRSYGDAIAGLLVIKDSVSPEPPSSVKNPSPSPWGPTRPVKQHVVNQTFRHPPLPTLPPHEPLDVQDSFKPAFSEEAAPQDRSSTLSFRPFAAICPRPSPRRGSRDHWSPQYISV